MGFDLVDLVILAATVIGLANGYRRGFWLSAAQYAGLVGGVVLGAAAATPVLNYLDIHNPGARPLGAALVLVIGGSLGSSIGFAAGEPIRRRILRTGVHTATDSIGGAALSVVAVLTMCWFLGLSFSRGPSNEIAQQIQRSVILHTLDGAAPRPPAFLASVEGILSGVNFSPVFAGLEPGSLPAALPIPASVDTAAVRQAAQSVVKVASIGCGGIVTGSGFPVASGYIVTNAHVVSGTSAHTVLTPAGAEMQATVVFFDPERDVAVIYAPGYRGTPLTFGTAKRGTAGAVIGYPGGGPEQTSPAIVDGEVSAEGRDIYNSNLVTRQILVIQARVRPGNSGGPLVDPNGQVIGLVFATSAGDPNQAYALTNGEIASDIKDAQSHPSPTDTSSYACAA
ncbi:MAG TPA: MarP family serine protease [Candidatus Dormibacteraeota bacterium]|nr:MarP family serine protease [Candidatus Dormibacteraeota bacterium]